MSCPLSRGKIIGQSVFVAKVNAAGSERSYYTAFGYLSAGSAIAVDAAGNAYVTGDAGDSSFPTTPEAFDTSYDNNDAFVVKFNASGSIAYATFLGGSSGDYGQGIAIDDLGNAYVTGITYSSDFPTTAGAFDTSYNGGGMGGGDAFLVKMNANGSDLIYAAFLGGSDSDNGRAIAVDIAGNAYVTGYTFSTNFPITAEAIDSIYNDGGDVFVAKMSNSGTELVYATFIGGSNWDDGRAIAVDREGNAYVTGETTSNFPTTPGAFDTIHSCYQTAFVFRLELDLHLAKRSPSFVEPGDILTYTVQIHNYALPVSQAVLTDTFPPLTTYISNTAAATSGNLTATTNSIAWSGAVTTGQLITITFQVTVSAAATDSTPIVNQVLISDVVASTTTIVDSKLPTGSLIINSGADYTYIPTVTLTTTANDSASYVAEMQFRSEGAGWGTWESYATSGSLDMRIAILRLWYSASVV